MLLRIFTDVNLEIKTLFQESLSMKHICSGNNVVGVRVGPSFYVAGHHHIPTTNIQEPAQ